MDGKGGSLIIPTPVVWVHRCLKLSAKHLVGRRTGLLHRIQIQEQGRIQVQDKGLESHPWLEEGGRQ